MLALCPLRVGNHARVPPSVRRARSSSRLLARSLPLLLRTSPLDSLINGRHNSPSPPARGYRESVLEKGGLSLPNHALLESHVIGHPEVTAGRRRPRLLRSPERKAFFASLSCSELSLSGSFAFFPPQIIGYFVFRGT